MPLRARRPLGLVLLILVALALGACSRVVGPRTWTETAELVNGGSFTIDVRDSSGRIDDVEIDPPDVVVPEAIVNPAGRPNVLLVSWTGGACDERTDIAIASNGPGLAIRIKTTVAPRDCEAIGVGHVLQLTSSEPLPVATVSVTIEP